MKPCKTCPFRRSVTPGQLGGSPVKTYIGQTHAAFYIPCHCHIDYSDPHWKDKPTEVPHCAGAAIFRSNVGMTHLPDSIMQPADTVEVFANVEEFAQHHATPEEYAALPSTPECVRYELNRAGVQYHNVPQFTKNNFTKPLTR